MEHFLQRELEEVLTVRKGEHHNVLFIPDTFLFKELTEKVINLTILREIIVVASVNKSSSAINYTLGLKFGMGQVCLFNKVSAVIIFYYDLLKGQILLTINRFIQVAKPENFQAHKSPK